MRPELMASLSWSSSGSPLRLANGSTASDRSEGAGRFRVCQIHRRPPSRRRPRRRWPPVGPQNLERRRSGLLRRTASWSLVSDRRRCVLDRRSAGEFVHRASASCSSSALWYRSAGSFSRQRLMTLPSSSGSPALSVPDPWRCVAEDRRDDLRRAVGVERVLPRGHAVEDGPEGEDVRSVVGRLTLELFRGHVGGGAEDLTVTGQKLGFHQGIAVVGRGVGDLHLGEPEVEHLEVAVAVHHDVAGFEVPVGHAAGVGRVQGIDEGRRESVKLGHRQPRRPGPGRRAPARRCAPW